MHAWIPPAKLALLKSLINVQLRTEIGRRPAHVDACTTMLSYGKDSFHRRIMRENGRDETKRSIIKEESSHVSVSGPRCFFFF